MVSTGSCVIASDCPSGYYGDATSKSCLACDSSCVTCNGGTANDCQSCDTAGGKYLSTNTCLSCDSACTTCNGGTHSDCLTCTNGATPNPSSGGGSCTVCGNGVVESGEACDDNNTNNNDGCSDSCQVETGWTCSGTPSVCSCQTGYFQRAISLSVNECVSTCP